MKALSVAGTAAMFLVGGGILSHGVPPLHHAIEQLAQSTGPLAGTVVMLIDGLLGIAAGALVLGVITVGRKLSGKNK
jgi:predicted DNA repair protein MutK